MAQSPVKEGLHCKARYDHHPVTIKDNAAETVSASSLTMPQWRQKQLRMPSDELPQEVTV